MTLVEPSALALLVRKLAGVLGVEPPAAAVRAMRTVLCRVPRRHALTRVAVWLDCHQ